MDKIKVSATSLILLLSVFSHCSGQGWTNHYGSSSEYLHSNDTMKLVLSQSTKNALHGRSNDRVNLEFILQNNGLAGHFTLQLVLKISLGHSVLKNKKYFAGGCT